MIDIFTTDTLSQIRAFLLDVGIEAATKALATLVVNPEPALSEPIKVPPDISTTSPVVADSPQPAASPSAPQPPAAPPLSQIPVALVPSDEAYFIRAVWSDVYVKNLSKAEADQAVVDFKASFL